MRAGLTQADLAARAGTTQSAIARWESGATRPSLESLRRLIRACGLELRLGLGDRDSVDASQIEGNLALTPAQRLDQLARIVAFIREGRAAMARRRG